MYCLDYAERLQPNNVLSFKLHELVFLRYNSQFASNPYSFASYSYRFKVLQPYVAATVKMHSDVAFSFIVAFRMTTVIKV